MSVLFQRVSGVRTQMTLTSSLVLTVQCFILDLILVAYFSTSLQNTVELKWLILNKHKIIPFVTIWTRSGKTKIMYEWVTKHSANANDNMYASVALLYTDINDDSHACVAPHDALTTVQVH